MEKFKLSESILADRLILLKRSHEHDVAGDRRKPGFHPRIFVLG